MQTPIVVQRPVVTPPKTKLLLIFHGVGSSASAMLPLGRSIASLEPDAWVVSVGSPDLCALGAGWQWFSVKGITEANRPSRVAATMPRFLQTIKHWQEVSGADVAGTSLVGFSQGAIMALESTQQSRRNAAHVVAIAGRFAQTPGLPAPGTVLHLMHGELDNVMPIARTNEIEQRLLTLGTQVTVDRFPNLGHEFDGDVVAAIARRLPQGSASSPASAALELS